MSEGKSDWLCATVEVFPGKEEGKTVGVGGKFSAVVFGFGFSLTSDGLEILGRAIVHDSNVGVGGGIELCGHLSCAPFGYESIVS